MDYNAESQTEPVSKVANERNSGGSDVFAVSIDKQAQMTQDGQMRASASKVSSGKNSLKSGLKSIIQGDLGLGKKKNSVVQQKKGGQKMVTVKRGRAGTVAERDKDVRSEGDKITDYRNKIKSIAHDHFDPTSKKDKLFFTYLNRLLEGPELAHRELQGQGIKLLNEFVLGPTTITREIKEREREIRWAKAKEERLARGENPIELNQVLNALNLIYMTAAQAKDDDDTVPTRQNIEISTMDPHGKIDMSKKNYHMQQKLGLGDRSIMGRRRWEDPNPVKYGGPTGYIALKNANDTRFQANKKLQEELDVLTGLKPKPKVVETPSRKVLDMTYASDFNHGNVHVPSVRSVLVEPSYEQKLINERPRMPEIFKNKKIPETIESQVEKSSLKTGQSRNSRFSRTSTVKPVAPQNMERFELVETTSGDRLNTHENIDFNDQEDLLKNRYIHDSMKKQFTTVAIKSQPIQRKVHNEASIVLNNDYQNQLYQQSSIFRQEQYLEIPTPQPQEQVDKNYNETTLSLLQSQGIQNYGSRIMKPLSKGKYRRAGYQGISKQRQGGSVQKTNRVFNNMEEALKIQNEIQQMTQDQHLAQLYNQSQENLVSRAMVGGLEDNQQLTYDKRTLNQLSHVVSNQKLKSQSGLDPIGQFTADTADSQSIHKKSMRDIMVVNAQNISADLQTMGHGSTAELSQSASTSVLGGGKITIKQYNSALGQYSHQASAMGVFGPQSNIEATVEKVIQLDRTTENIELQNYLRINRKNPVKYLVKHQGGSISPSFAKDIKSKQFNSLVKEIDNRVKTRNKARFKDDQIQPDQNYLVNTNQIQPPEGSMVQSPSKRKLSYEEIKLKFFEEGGHQCQAVFTYDGLIAKDLDTIKSIKFDISKSIQKYRLPVNKFLAKLSDDHIKVQKKFNKQAYSELLEKCSDSLIDQGKLETDRKISLKLRNQVSNENIKDERPVSPYKFKMMWTPDGKPLKTLEQLMDHIYERWQFQDAVVQTKQMLLPLIGNREEDVKKNPALILLSMHKNRKDGIQIKIGNQLEYADSETDDTVTEKNQGVQKPSHDFVGIKDKYNLMNEREIRNSLSKEKKHNMLQINRKWSIKQQIKWIQQNNDPAGGRIKYDDSNLENTFKKDAQSDYLSSNVSYRQKISKKVHQSIVNSARHQIEGSGQGYSSNRAHYNKIGKNSSMQYESPKKRDMSKTPMKFQVQSPAFFNDGTISTTSFQLPQIKDQNNVSNNFLKVPTGATSQLQQYSNKLTSDAHFMSRDSSIQNIQGAPTFDVSDLASRLGNGYNQKSIKSQQQLLANKYKPIQTPNLMNLERGKIDLKQNPQGETWNSAFLSKVESLRSKYRAPDVVRQHAIQSMMQVPSAGAPKARIQNKVVRPEKKKDKDDQHKQDTLDVKNLSDQYLLPSKVIYQLNSEFNCLKDIAKQSQQQDNLPVTLPTTESIDDSVDNEPTNKFTEFKKKQEEEEQKKKLASGIQVKKFIISCQELQDKHSHTKERIMDALGLSVSNKSSIVDWNAFLKLKTVLKYFTATKDQMLEFWMKFLNPQNVPTLPRQTLYIELELLARGSFTTMPTLISHEFAEGFIKMLDNRKCIIYQNNEGSKESSDDDSIDITDQILAPEVDMILFKKLIMRNKIDIEYLNQCLKSDNDYIMEGDDDDM